MRSVVVALSLTLLAAGEVWASVEGYAESKGFSYATRHVSEDEQAVAWGTLYVKGVGQSGDSVVTVSARLEGNTAGEEVFRLDPADRREERSALSVREAWVRTPLNPSVDLQVGRFLLGWGKTDGFSPADAFLPRDLTDPFADEKLGLWGARVLGQWGETRLELVGVPVTTPWRMPEVGSRFAPVPFDLKYLRESEETPPDGGFGAVRVLSHFAEWDFGVWGRSGYLPAPTVDFERIPYEFAVRELREWVYENGVGAEVSRLLGSWMARAELGAFIAGGDRVNDAYIWALSVERAWDDYSLIATVADNMGARGDAVDIPYDRALLPLFVAALSGQHPWGEWKTTWMAGLRKGDGLAKAEIGYALTDALKATLGGDYPYGPTEGALGALRDGRRGWAALKYSW